MFVEGWPRALLPVVESHILAAPPAVVVIDEWSALLAPGAARSGGEGQDDAARASVEGQRCQSTRSFGKSNSVAEALGRTLQRRRGLFSNSSIEWSTDNS